MNNDNLLDGQQLTNDVIPNIALMLKRSALNYSNKTAFQARKNNKYSGITWDRFYKDIVNISFNLRKYGLNKVYIHLQFEHFLQ